MWWKKHGISIVHSKYPIKRRLREGLLLKVQFNILCTILLGVTLREYGIYEPSYGWRQSIRFSWCFSLRSLPSTIPWACWRRMMHHHALSHSRAIGTELDNDHRHPEPGEAFTQCLRMSSLDFCQEAAHWPSPANRPLPHFPGAYSVWITALRVVHWETGQRPGQVPEAQRVSLVPSGTHRWNSKCLILARVVSMPFRRKRLNFRSFTSLLLANNYKYFLINALQDL